MSVIHLLLSLIVISPEITEWEQHQLKITPIPIHYSQETITAQKARSIINIYNQGMFLKYRKQFEKYQYQLINGDYFKHIFYYALTLKRLNDQKYPKILCQLQNHKEKLPSFILREIPKKCPNMVLAQISVNQIKLYINGLKVNHSYYHLNQSQNKLYFCLKDQCRLIIQDGKNISEDQLLQYFQWREKKDYIESYKISPHLLSYYSNSWIIFYHKKNDIIFKTIYHNQKMIEQKMMTLDQIDKNDLLNIHGVKSLTSQKKRSTPLYKKRAFYIITGLTLLIIGGGIYWYTEQNQGEKGSIYWGY